MKQLPARSSATPTTTSNGGNTSPVPPATSRASSTSRPKGHPTLWLAALTASSPSGSQLRVRQTWRGLVVAPEHRCSPYERKRDYPYPQSVEREIVRALGRVYGPYTGRCFASTRDTDIKHVVAISEAHDSGLCAADRATRRRFAQDLQNLTLASHESTASTRAARTQASGSPTGTGAGSQESAGSEAGLPPHRRPPRSGGPGPDPSPVPKHSHGAGSLRRRAGAAVGDEPRPGHARRRALTLRRQPERPDHVQGGAPTRDRARPPFAPCLPVHARRRRGRPGLRVNSPTPESDSESTPRRRAFGKPR